MESIELIGVGDHTALDFLNSSTKREGFELLPDGPSYLAWLELTGLIDDFDKRAVTEHLSDAELNAAAADAAELREWLRPVVAAWATGSTVSRSVRDRLNKILVADHRYLELYDDHGTTATRERRRWTAADQLLIPVAEATAQLLTSADRNLVRMCEDPTCALWFYDRTKSHRRRWCSMAVCGNRAKARNHRARDQSARRR